LNNTLNKTLTNPLSLHERNKVWKEQKEARLTVHREMNKDRDLKGCTFQPDIVRRRGLYPILINFKRTKIEKIAVLEA